MELGKEAEKLAEELGDAQAYVLMSMKGLQNAMHQLDKDKAKVETLKKRISKVLGADGDVGKRMLFDAAVDAARAHRVKLVMGDPAKSAATRPAPAQQKPEPEPEKKERVPNPPAPKHYGSDVASENGASPGPGDGPFTFQTWGKSDRPRRELDRKDFDRLQACYSGQRIAEKEQVSTYAIDGVLYTSVGYSQRGSGLMEDEGWECMNEADYPLPTYTYRESNAANRFTYEGIVVGGTGKNKDARYVLTRPVIFYHQDPVSPQKALEAKQEQERVAALGEQASMRELAEAAIDAD